MSKKPADPGQIPKLLNLAFRVAEKGDSEGAWRRWQEAIDHGYRGLPQTRRQLEWVIRNKLPFPLRKELVTK